MHILPPTQSPNSFDERTLLVVGFLFLPLLAITFGSSIPAGIFMPTILIGSSLGGYAGIMIERHLMNGISPSTFSLVGATALLGGIQRSTVALCVIIMEGTGETKFLIPIVVTTVVSKWVGDHFTSGLYEIGIEIRKYPYLDHHVHKAYDLHTAGEVMTRDVVCLPSMASLKEIENALTSCSHNGFPVLDKDTQNILGVVRRDQLIAMVKCGVYVLEQREGEETQKESEREDNIVTHRHTMMSEKIAHRRWEEFYSSGSGMHEGMRAISADSSFHPNSSLRRSEAAMSFLSDPITAALAVGNDCKFPDSFTSICY